MSKRTEEVMDYIKDNPDLFITEDYFLAPRRRLGKGMNVPPSTIYYRLKKLQRMKKIKGYYSPGVSSIYKLN